MSSSSLGLQDGQLSGWTPHPDEIVDDHPDGPRWHQAVWRGPTTLVIPNRGDVPTGVDVEVDATAPMPAPAVAGDYGARAAVAPGPATTLALRASDRTRTVDGQPWIVGARLPILPPVDAKLQVDPGSRIPWVGRVRLEERTDGPEPF